MENPTLFPGGGPARHVRHIIEYYRAFLRRPDDGGRLVDYDARPRDLSIEATRAAALAALEDLIVMLAAFPRENLAAPIATRDTERGSVCDYLGTSTCGRELLFLLSHTVHHLSIVALMLRVQGLDVPQTLGVAPSTLAYQERTGQAHPAAEKVI